MNAQRRLSDRAMTGVMWTYAATAARLLLQMGFTAVLARVLGPVPFGIVGMAMGVIGLAGIVVDQGLGAALIQRSSVTPDQIRVVFTRLLAASAAASLLGIAASGWISEFFREPALRMPMMALSLVLLPTTLASVSVAVLRRQLRIRAVQSVSVATYATGFGLVALPLALSGFGVWSLVAGTLVHFSLAAVAYYHLTRHPLRLSRGGTSGLSRFGARAASAGLLSWFAESFPGMMVGRVFGPAAAGTFNAAFNLARTSASAFSTGGLEMLFTSSARAADSSTFRRRAFSAAFGLTALVSLPTFATLATVPETLVIVFYGPLWTEAISLLPPLALAMPALMLSGVAGSMLSAAGRPGRELLAQTVLAAVVTLGVLTVIGHSTLAATWVLFGAMWLRMVITLLMAVPIAPMKWREVGAALRPGIVLAIIVPAAVHLLDEWLFGMQIHLAIVLVADAVLGAVLLAAGTVLLRGLLAPEAGWAIAQVLRRVPYGATARLAPMFERAAAQSA